MHEHETTAEAFNAATTLCEIVKGQVSTTDREEWTLYTVLAKGYRPVTFAGRKPNWTRRR